jgi:hypothetical protein
MPSWNNNTEYESLIYHQNLVLHRNVPLFNRICTHAGSNWAMTEILVDESWQSGCTTWFIGEANKFHPHDWNFATLLEGAWSCCEANSSPPSINSNAQLSWFDPGGFFFAGYTVSLNFWGVQLFPSFPPSIFGLTSLAFIHLAIDRLVRHQC